MSRIRLSGYGPGRIRLPRVGAEPAGSLFASQVEALSPTFWWKAQEESGPVLVDSSGNDRHGTFGGHSGGNHTFGKPGLVPNDPESSAVQWNGQAYGEVPFDSGMNTTTLTLVSFLKPDAVGSDYSLLDRDSTASGHARIYQWRITNSGKLQVIWWTADGTERNLATSNGVLTNTDAHMAVLTLDGADARLWACNLTTEVVTTASTPYTGDLRTASTPLSIGASRGGSGASAPAFQFYDGDLGDQIVFGQAVAPVQVNSLIAAALTEAA